MIKLTLLTSLLVVSTGVSAAASNSPAGNISTLVTRASGSHTVTLSNGVPVDQGCTYNDRGIVVDSDAGGKSLLASLLFAVGNGKQVSIRVDGCTAVDPGLDATTAPRIIKVQVLI